MGGFAVCDADQWVLVKPNGLIQGVLQGGLLSPQNLAEAAITVQYGYIFYSVFDINRQKHN